LNRIAVIPLDSRPCNTSWMTYFAKQANIDIATYPRELCGDLHTGANMEHMFDWLDQQVGKSSHVIISADGLCSGGLVQARLGKIDVEGVVNKLSQLEKYKASNPDLKIYLFDTIMRTSITSHDEESERYWGKMNEYSKALGHSFFFHEEQSKAKIQELEKEIPAHIIATYLKARDVKHRLNQYFIKQTADQVIDYMILLQEDSMPYGIQKKEQIAIEHQIEELGISNKVKFYNGTDEGGVVLLARIITQIAMLQPKIYIHLPKENAIDKVMPFEDHPFQENLDGMFETIGFTKAINVEESDFILSIYTQEDDYNLNINGTDEIKPLVDETYKKYMDELNSLISKGKKVAFVDLLFPNGGSVEMLKEIDFKNLTIYSAWNTASNAMGSCLCDVAVAIANPHYNSDKFKYERILDDCIYQYVVRRKINVKYSKQGYNVFDLGDKSHEVLCDIVKEMKQHASWIGKMNYRISLPWNRTFEIDIELRQC